MAKSAYRALGRTIEASAMVPTQPLTTDTYEPGTGEALEKAVNIWGNNEMMMEIQI